MEPAINAFDFQDIKVSIGEAAKIVGVAPHTIRFWEKEFDFYLSSERTGGRQRRYDEDALEKLKKVYGMLKEDGYSIAGAKRALYFELKDGSTKEVTEEEITEISTEEKTIADRIAQMIKSELIERKFAAEM